MQEVGFTDIKYWYQPQNIFFESGEDFMDLVENSPMKQRLATVPAERMAEVRKAAIEMFDKETGKGTTDMKTFECMVIYARRV